MQPTAKPKVLAIIGPTASGKSKIALELGELINIEIISLDSALIYKNMDIGTAKPSIEERQNIPHHLIDIISPIKTYSAANFVEQCTELIADIQNRNRLPVIVGGTMMYFQALTKGLNNTPASTPEVRAKVKLLKDQNDLNYLYEILLTIDRETANRLEKTDSQRIERALEVYFLSGKPLSFFHTQNSIPNIQDEIYTISLIPEERKLLHQSIETRFLKMLNHGLIDEVLFLKKCYPQLSLDFPSMRSVGYRQVWEYLNKALTEQEMIDKGIYATRQLAKRQLTWLKRFNSNLKLDPFSHPFAEIKNQVKIWYD